MKTAVLEFKSPRAAVLRPDGVWIADARTVVHWDGASSPTRVHKVSLAEITLLAVGRDDRPLLGLSGGGGFRLERSDGGASVQWATPPARLSGSPRGLARLKAKALKRLAQDRPTMTRHHVAAVSGDGQRLVVGGASGRLSVYDREGKSIGSLTLPTDGATHLTVSDDGRYVHGAHDAHAWSALWDLQTLQPVELPVLPSAAAAFLDDAILRVGGRVVASPLDGSDRVRLGKGTSGRVVAWDWDASTRRIVVVFGKGLVEQIQL